MAEQTILGRVWGFHARETTLALNGFKERRFFTADIGASILANFDVEIVFGVEDVRAKHVIVVELIDGFLDTIQGFRVFISDEDISCMSVGRVCADHQTLDHTIGIPFHHDAVFECARFRLVKITDEILRLTLCFAGEFPLQTGWEPGTAATSQARLLHFGDDLFGRHVEEGLFQARKGAFLLVSIQIDCREFSDCTRDLAHITLDVRFWRLQLSS